MAQYTLARLAPEYRKLWRQMIVTKTAAADQQARKVIANKKRYRGIEEMTGVPWFVIGCLHMRESNGDFRTYLGNGQPLNRVTTIVPRNRGPFATFEEGAHDALVVVEHLDEIKDWGPEHVAYAAEKFNGFGYRHPNRNIPSPYLWGGTTIQKPGKFVADGVYDPNVMDPQIGAMAVLRRIMDLDESATFPDEKPKPVVPKADPKPGTSPRADDTESQVKPLSKSKTIWGAFAAIGAFITSMGTALLDFLQTPLGFSVFCICILVFGGGAYLVIKGRLDVQKIIQHLSAEDA